MKRFLVVFLMVSSLLYCADYFNVNTASGYRHELISNIQEITFDGSDVKFKLVGGTTATLSMDDILGMTLEETSQGDNSLPVELLYFNATQKEGTVYLNWETATEVNNRGFEIERICSELTSWKVIGFVHGQGNSSTSNSYNFTDENVSHYSSLRYRLKQIDTDGSSEYSEEVVPTVEEIKLPTVFKLHNNYPNPFNPETVISYELVKAAQTEMTIYDMCGNKVQTLVNEYQNQGNYKINFNAADKASGVYFCVLNSGNNTQLIKMLLMK